MPFTPRSDQQIYRLDYLAPTFRIPHLDLHFSLDPKVSRVRSQFKVIVEENIDLPHTIKLHGSKMLFDIQLKIDGKEEDINSLLDEAGNLSLTLNAREQLIEIKNSVSPAANSALSGLYLSRGIICSDCEPQGFRNITLFPDRPDVMTQYRVTLEADQCYPILLSNGNLIENGVLDEARHYAIWEDPYPKPTYLFAIVAGDLQFIEDQHIRPDGRPVQLRIYASKENIGACDFALESLKKAMRWDEDRFGLACDLDFYNVVAVDDFNSGAMENKGLNLFNTSCILATKEQATDRDFRFVEAVIAHEYFHNWTGNRITCQDWFNLSLKESLTVFREQEFMSEVEPGIRRIEDVNFLRLHQFPEDQGPLSHAVRPDKLGSIENIYTTTTYEKGAEIIRLYQTILGREGFDRGFARYIKEFDGMAVTVDDFYAAMKMENPRLFENFPLWYSQRGTPKIQVATEYYPDKREMRLSLKQFLFDPVTNELQEPLPIPIKYAFFNRQGEMLLEETYTLTMAHQCLIFHNIDEVPVISLLRDFSAPVMVDYPQSIDDLKILIQYERDYFAKWDAAQKLVERLLFNRELAREEQIKMIGDAFAPLFDYAYQEPGFAALLLTLPDNDHLFDRLESEEILPLYQIKREVEVGLATRFQKHWQALYDRFQEDSIAARAIKNVALHYLSRLPHESELAVREYEKADNMTDINAALTALLSNQNPKAKVILESFYHRYEDDALLVDRYFSLLGRNPNLTMDDVAMISNHPAFDLKNPNRARAIVGSIGRNRIALARIGAPLYRWIGAEIVKIDKINAVTAARLVTPFAKLSRLPEPLKEEVRAICQEMLNIGEISHNLSDQLKRILL